MSQQFTSNGSYLVTGTSTPAIPSTGTISLWFNPQYVNGDGLFHLFFEASDPSFQYLIQIYAGPNDRLYVGWSNAGGSLPLPVNSPGVVRNSWQHLAVTWVNGGSMTMFFQGVQIGTASPTTVQNTAGYPWSFGNRSGGSFYGQCKLALFGMWSRVLSGSEITSLAAANAPSTVPSGLFAEYDLHASNTAAQAGTAGPLTATSTTAADDPTPPAPPQARISQAVLELALAQQSKARVAQGFLEAALAQEAKARLGQTFLEAAVVDAPGGFFGTFIGFWRTGSFGGGTPEKRPRARNEAL